MTTTSEVRPEAVAVPKKDSSPKYKSRRVELQRRASKIIRGHLLRDFVRVASLVLTDVAVFASLGFAIDFVRSGTVLGEAVGTAVQRWFPEGFLGGWQFGVALLVGLVAAAQEEFFFRMFPDQVDVGPNKPSTIEWLLSRTRDGTKLNTPRELIHFLNSLRAEQMRRYELGEPDPDGESLFDRAAFKDSLPEVSKVRLTQTLYAEHGKKLDNQECIRGR
ncbi:MAG: hypothetical protein IH859_00935 [Chloroflexi bacterium]|nr:hypothetical protein [Chloroflexota bacterium]